MHQRNRGIRLDPWAREADNRASVPDDALFVLEFQADELGLAEYEDALYLRRADRTDELWALSAVGFGFSELRHGGVRLSPGNVRGHIDTLRQGRVAEAPRAGTRRDAAAALLQPYLSAVTDMSRVKGCIAAGILGPRDLEAFLTVNKRRRQRHTAAAQLRADRTPSLVVAAARQLGLNPEPAARGSNAWWANCPGTGHRLCIETGQGQFGCGYCRKKGGVAELRALVAERRARAGKQASRPLT